MDKIEIINDNSDITSNSKQIALLKEHFPQCFDKDGNFIVLRMEEIVGQDGLELSKESYSLNWLGKSYARLLANENPHTLIKEDKKHNAQEPHSTSKNLLIKGDNLEVLKHLSNAYSEEIKMIYIDPPYNTGSDGFVYQDDRKFTAEELSQLAGVELEEAKHILEFTQSKANSHSAWLTFMYPRLYVARHLLKDDGVIFISIDDNEVSQLKLLCDEIFGESNQLGPIIHNKLNSKSDTINIQQNHEYVICYRKKASYVTNTKVLPSIIRNEIKTKEAFKDGERFYILNDPITTRGEGGTLNKRKNLGYTIYFNPSSDDFIGVTDYDVALAKTSNNEDEVYHDEKNLINDGYIKIRPPKVRGKLGAWTWELEKFNKDKDHILIKKTKNGYSVRKKTFISTEEVEQKNGKFFVTFNSQNNSRSIIEYSTNDGTTQLSAVLGKEDIFNNPKNIELIQYLIDLIPGNDFILLDFFAGSGSALHALLKLNNIDNGSRQFIGIQIEEKCTEESSAFLSGYKTIFEITKDRIIKSAQKIKEENPSYNGDLGFRIFETTPLFNGYLEDIEQLKEDSTLFDGTTLSKDELETLLTTWRVYDGMLLSESLEKITLQEYKAYSGNGTVYMMHTGFSTGDLKSFIKKLDEDSTFEPSKVVLFGYNFTSKHQREFKEALASYMNRKSIELDLIVRY